MTIWLSVIINANTEIGVYNAATGIYSTLMSFYASTEGMSPFSFNEDRTKVAFVSLNYKEYPKGSRIFVLSLQNGKVVKKQKLFMKPPIYGFIP